MPQSKEEIQEELEHKQNLLKTYNRNRRVLEQRMAELGSQPDLVTLNDIDKIAARIRETENDIALLETRSIERDLSFEEAEYRAILARAWNTERGEPSYADRAKLEYERLRLRLPFERTETLEAEVKKALAVDICKHIEMDLRRDIRHFMMPLTFYEEFGRHVRNSKHVTEDIEEEKKRFEILQPLGRVIRFDVEFAILLIQQIMQQTPIPETVNIADFERRLHTASRYAQIADAPDYKDAQSFARFMNMFRIMAMNCGWIRDSPQQGPPLQNPPSQVPLEI